MGNSALIISLGIGLIIAYVASKVLGLQGNAQGLPLPPGPKGLPVVGNVNDLPKPGVVEAHHWLKHKDLYGPLSSVTVMGQTLVIINDMKLAFELLEKRSVKHSSRPNQIFAGQMVGWEHSLGLSQYNDRFRAHRKNMSRIIGSKTTAAQFAELQEAEAARYLRHMLDSPENLLDHIRKEVGSIILRITYGYTAEPHKSDPLVDMAGEAMDKFGQAAVPGAFMVDMFPLLRHLPDWFPGAGFQKTGRQWAAELVEVTEKPYAFVKRQMAAGRNQPSFLSRLLEAGESGPEEVLTNKWTALSLYTAGADTTVSALATFYLAMTLYPEVQRAAQEEIDRVVGRDRLPTFADRPNLPYLEAVVKEVHRWHPVAPMGLPHTSTVDDVCEGYFIPKGSILLANIWHFTHDPAAYHSPTVFKPERFLEQDGRAPERDPRDVVFGFGRRICPGRILADNSLYINIAQSLAVFDVGKKSPETPAPVVAPEAGIVCHPGPFETQVKPRSPHHMQLIRATEDVYPWEESDCKELDSAGY